MLKSPSRSKCKGEHNWEKIIKMELKKRNTLNFLYRLWYSLPSTCQNAEKYGNPTECGHTTFVK